MYPFSFIYKPSIKNPLNAKKTVSVDSDNSHSENEVALLAAKFVSQFEGFLPKAVWDVNAWRGGHGSDEKTFPDGTFRKVVKGDTFTMEDADRDEARRIKNEFIPKIKKQIGDGWNKLSDKAKVALVSFAYNYGSISKKKLKEAAKAGDNKAVAFYIVNETLNDNMGLEKANGWSKTKADKVRESLKARRKKESNLILS